MLGEVRNACFSAEQRVRLVPHAEVFVLWLSLSLVETTACSGVLLVQLLPVMG
jgi:hypothetical protein